jgi:hypothetical protein
VPPGADAPAHWLYANGEALPRFFSLAREAGVRKAVLIGSFYPQVEPSLVDSDPYVRSRHLACTGARAQAAPGFDVCSLNAPFMVGSVPGLPSPIFLCLDPPAAPTSCRCSRFPKRLLAR